MHIPAESPELLDKRLGNQSAWVDRNIAGHHAPFVGNLASDASDLFIRPLRSFTPSPGLAEEGQDVKLHFHSVAAEPTAGAGHRLTAKPGCSALVAAGWQWLAWPRPMPAARKRSEQRVSLRFRPTAPQGRRPGMDARLGGRARRAGVSGCLGNLAHPRNLGTTALRNYPTPQQQMDSRRPGLRSKRVFCSEYL